MTNKNISIMDLEKIIGYVVGRMDAYLYIFTIRQTISALTIEALTFIALTITTIFIFIFAPSVHLFSYLLCCSEH